MRKILSQIIAATAGLWVSSMFISGVKVTILPDSNVFGVSLTQLWQIFLVLGIVIGLLNRFIKPLLAVLTLPLQIITLGLFTFIINLGLMWLVDIAFREFTAPLLWPLVSTAFIISAFNIIISYLVASSKK